MHQPTTETPQLDDMIKYLFIPLIAVMIVSIGTGAIIAFNAPPLYFHPAGTAPGYLEYNAAMYLYSLVIAGVLIGFYGAITEKIRALPTLALIGLALGLALPGFRNISDYQIVLFGPVVAFIIAAGGQCRHKL